MSDNTLALAPALYLAELAPRSRVTQGGALRAWARAAGRELAAVDWPALALLAPAQLRAWSDAGLAPATVRGRAAALAGVLRQLWRTGALTGDQFARLRPSVPGGSRVARGRALSRAQVAALRAVVPRGPLGLRDRAMVALLYGAGLRRAEAAALTLDALEGWEGLEASARVAGKGGRERRVPLPPFVVAELAPWLRWRGSAPGPVLCAPFRSCPLSPGQLGRRVTRLAELAGLGHLCAHDLRRSFVSGLLGAGADVLAVSRLVGHASTATTARYDLRGEREARAAAERLPW